MKYCLYLRKSRADMEAEAHGEGETLARHEKILLEVAKKMKLNITEIYREIVSGETIASRPVMQHLLQEVEQGIWEGVLVMEIERLARGDTIDQGIVAQTFKYSGTKIITPMKTYNPSNEFDEEYFEFGLFMSRREYKTINRRLQNGRVASVKEGKYVANTPPYGYERVKLEKEKGWTLAPIEQEAEIVRLIFELYTTGEKQSNGNYKRLGTALIARRLNDMKIPSKKGGKWVIASIRDILINPVYIGKVRWNWRKSVKKIVDGQITMSRPRSDSEECLIVDGLHPAIISEQIFKAAQELMSKNPPRPMGEKLTTKNPLAGLVVCGKCGHKMVRRPYSSRTKYDTLICSVNFCDNVSSNLELVEAHILNSIREWLTEYKLKWNNGSNTDSSRQTKIKVKEKALNKLKTELETLHTQLEKTHDLLEQGVYDVNTFLERSRSVSERIDNTKKDIEILEKDLRIEIIREENSVSIIPKAEHLLEVYHKLPDAQSKNDMLKDVLEKVIYVKEKGIRWHGSADEFEITIYPKIPYSDK